MFFTIYKFSQNFSREKLQRKSDCSKFEEGTNTLFFVKPKASSEWLNFENVSICIHFRFHHQGPVLKVFLKIDQLRNHIIKFYTKHSAPVI